VATEHFLNWIEGKAQGLRNVCKLSTFARLDPFELARTLEVNLVNMNELSLNSEIMNQLTLDDPGAWSAGLLFGPDGRKLVVLNPTHNARRHRASLMEELAHVWLEHKPSRLISFDGVIIRTWKKTYETEAYWVGAAALLPRRLMKGARTLGRDAVTVANEHMVSEDLVHFREKVLGVHLPRPLRCKGSGGEGHLFQDAIGGIQDLAAPRRIKTAIAH
jgi:IrrE N-terminal-like domain